MGEVTKALERGGILVRRAKRGLDHGVWVPFKVAFEGKTDIPVVQVSLPGVLGFDIVCQDGHQGYGIMGTGQLVHNLLDLFSGRPMPYAEPFMPAVHCALTKSKPLEASMTLFRHPLYKQAHPTPEHLLPLIVSLGAVANR